MVWDDKTYIEKCKFALCLSISVLSGSTSLSPAPHYGCLSLLHIQSLELCHNSSHSPAFQRSSPSMLFRVCRFFLSRRFLPFVVPFAHKHSHITFACILPPNDNEVLCIRFRVWTLHIWIKRFIKLTSILPTAICSLAQVGNVQPPPPLVAFLMFCDAFVSSCTSRIACKGSKTIESSVELAWNNKQTKHNINTEIEMISTEKSLHSHHVRMSDRPYIVLCVYNFSRCFSSFILSSIFRFHWSVLPLTFTYTHTCMCICICTKLLLLLVSFFSRSIHLILLGAVHSLPRRRHLAFGCSDSFVGKSRFIRCMRECIV